MIFNMSIFANLNSLIFNNYFVLLIESHVCFILTEADKLCDRLNEKLKSVLGHKLVMDHMPLLMVCLEGLGKLAQKFPKIAGTSISYLRDFLVNPSPILAKLYGHAEAQQKKNKEMQPFKIVGKKLLSIICNKN